jgi:hypothetical protein
MKRWAIAGLGAAFGAVLLAASAWACVPVATLNATPQNVKPGDTVTVTGASYNSPNPVMLHWGALNGPVVAQLTPSSGAIGGTFTVPADAAPGNYVVVATQDIVPGVQDWGVPSRVLISVVGTDKPVLGATPGAQVTPRPSGFVTDKSVSGGSLLLVGLGAAGIAMFVAGIAAVAAGRRSPAPKAQPARK